MSDVSLRDYIERIFAERDRQVDDRFRAVALALEKSATANEARFTLLNEFRQTVNDTNARYATAEALDAMSARVIKLERFESRMLAYLSAAGVAGGVLSFVLTLLFRK